MRLSTKEALLGLSVVFLTTVITTVLPGALCLRLLAGPWQEFKQEFQAGYERRANPPQPRLVTAVPIQPPTVISIPEQAPVTPPVPTPPPVPARPQPPQALTVQEYLRMQPKEPVLVRGQVLLTQADSMGFVGQPIIGDSYILRDNAEAKETFPFELLRNKHPGRRCYFLLGTGATKTMTLKIHGGEITEIVSER